jgi:hypothetical protein
MNDWIELGSLIVKLGPVPFSMKADGGRLWNNLRRKLGEESCVTI